jgi:hypothetical protein
MLIHERRCRSSIFTCGPKFRLLRSISVLAIHPFRHARLSKLLRGQWCVARRHSSWSRG